MQGIYFKVSTVNEYMPALHSTQSSIENHFSCVRSIQKDITDLYGNAVVQSNVRANLKSFQLKGNSSYESGATTSNKSKYNIDQFDIQKINREIFERTSTVDRLVSQNQYVNEDMIATHLLPLKKGSSVTIAGFKMEQYFYDTELKNMQSYQGVLKNDSRFMSMYVLSIKSASATFFAHMLKPELKDIVNVICANIMEEIYRLLSSSSNSTEGFYGRVFKSILGTDESVMNDIVDNAEKQYKIKLNLKRIEMVILFNILLHIFVEEYLPNIITVYRNTEILSTTKINREIISFADPNIINTSDVNRLFGWALYKEKKLMNKMSTANKCNNVYLVKLEILEEMTVLITDVCLDTNYIKVYVPLDDRIRNKGYLTLISPRYAFIFAQILTMITKKTTVDVDSSQFTKPDKDKIKEFIFEKDKKKDEDHVNRLLLKVIEAPTMFNIHTDVVK